MPVTASTELKTEYGTFQVNYHKFDGSFCVSLQKGDISVKNSLVRLQSSCLFSESFHTIDCDCDLQLTYSMKMMSEEGNGVIVYSYEEGRGIGLENKIKALEIERTKSVDTVQAFEELHFDLDPRRYSNPVAALKELNIYPEIRLISNNPLKVRHLEEQGFIISSIVHLTYPLNEERKKYLEIKKNKLGHEL